jgi:hypothetical protein
MYAKILVVCGLVLSMAVAMLQCYTDYIIFYRSVYAKILAVCGLVLVSAAGNILVILAVARHRAMRWVPTLQVYILPISPFIYNTVLIWL